MSTTKKRKKLPEKTVIGRPFDPQVLRRARAIAARYRIALWREDGRWFGVGVEQPGTYGDGRTVQQAVKDTREALAATVAYLIEKGNPVAAPIMDEGRRRKAG